MPAHKNSHLEMALSLGKTVSLVYSSIVSLAKERMEVNPLLTLGWRALRLRVELRKDVMRREGTNEVVCSARSASKPVRRMFICESLPFGAPTRDVPTLVENRSDCDEDLLAAVEAEFAESDSTRERRPFETDTKWVNMLANNNCVTHKERQGGNKEERSKAI